MTTVKAIDIINSRTMTWYTRRDLRWRHNQRRSEGQENIKVVEEMNAVT